MLQAHVRRFQASNLLRVFGARSLFSAPFCFAVVPYLLAVTILECFVWSTLKSLQGGEFGDPGRVSFPFQRADGGTTRE